MIGGASNRTQVGIIGAGPAGLTLARLLQLEGIDAVVLESQTLKACRGAGSGGRARTGDRGSPAPLSASASDSVVRAWCTGESSFGSQGGDINIDFDDLTQGRGITIYGQQEVVKDLIEIRQATGCPLLFEVADVSLHDLTSDTPSLRFRHEERDCLLTCDFIAGCDGFHGTSRRSIPAGALVEYERPYPFAWLGILSASPPPSHELIYTHHDRGFALVSMRSPDMRPPDPQEAGLQEQIERWPDARGVGGAGPTRRARTAPLVACSRAVRCCKRVSPTCGASSSEPMQYGQVVPGGRRGPHRAADGREGAQPRGRATSPCCRRRYRTLSMRSGDDGLRSECSEICSAPSLEGAALFLVDDFDAAPVRGASAFDQRRQLAELDYVTSSRAAATTLAENYVGLPLTLDAGR